MKRTLGIVAVAALGIVGCGGDDGGDGDLAAYCELVEATATNTEFPTADDLEEYRDVAPGEISDEIDTLVDAFQGVDDPEDLDALIEALEEPEVADAIEEIEAFDAENCDSDGSGSTGDEETTTTAEPDDEEESDSTDTTSADDDEDDDEGASGTLCDEITDDEVSEVLGLALSSEDTSFNNEDTCNYESADGEAELFVGRIPDIGQPASSFQQTAETNFDDYEELDGIGDSAYFVTSEVSGASAAAMADGSIHTVTFDAGDDDPLAHRDVVIELLELLVAT